jgi:ABC-2 type transport system permease protein
MKFCPRSPKFLSKQLHKNNLFITKYYNSYIMNKIWLIIKREYWTRVRKKSFIFATILAPLGFALLIAVSLWLSTQGAEEKTLALLDDTDILQTKQGKSLKDSPYLRFKLLNIDLETAKNSLDSLKCVGLLHIPAQDTANLSNLRINYYSDEELGLASLEFVRSNLSNHLKAIKIKRAGLNETILASFETSVELSPKAIKKTNNSEKDAGSYRIYVATALSGLMMMLVYIVVFIYGNMVMRSVMEEKTNRIVEVIISSVKPFYLMVGKIVGVGAVGMTQFLIWAIVTPLLYMGVMLFFAPRLAEMAASQSANSPDININKINAIIAELSNFNYGSIVVFFLLFFLMGYVLYASLFAAVGSAMSDDWGEGQSLTLIIAIPVIIGFYIGMAAIQNPNGTLAFWASMFPLFSPIVMPARIVFEPAWWEIALSLFLLAANSVFFVWISGRIYRVGILMYGKKIGILEFIKFMFRSE